MTDVWNYADIVPPVGIMLVIVGDYFFKSGGAFDIFRVSMQALVCFGMWVKIFYFLRIFRQTGFFVNMLLKVMRSSRIFFLLYMLILCAFGCTFFILSPDGTSIFTSLNYAYLLGLGEFDMEWEDYAAPMAMQLFFIAATLIVMIVMLNLLIAIVSTAYEEVIEN